MSREVDRYTGRGGGRQKRSSEGSRFIPLAYDSFLEKKKKRKEKGSLNQSGSR